jgi:hypothetical protein
MKFIHPKSKLLAVILCGCLMQSVQAQQIHSSNGSVNSGGGSFSNDRVSIDWSIGEMLRIDTRISENKHLVVTQGLLQPDIGPQVVFVTDPNFAKGEIRILPNPVKSILKVQFTLKQVGRMKCMLFSDKGERLYQTTFNYYGYGYMQEINMMKLTNGSYFLYVELEPVEGPVIRKGSFKVLKID